MVAVVRGAPMRVWRQVRRRVAPMALRLNPRVRAGGVWQAVLAPRACGNQTAAAMGVVSRTFV